MEHDLLYKVCVIGDSGVGKSCVVQVQSGFLTAWKVIGSNSEQLYEGHIKHTAEICGSFVLRALHIHSRGRLCEYLSTSTGWYEMWRAVPNTALNQRMGMNG